MPIGNLFNKKIDGSAATTMTAANVKVVFNNKIVGFCTDLSWSINYGNKPIYTIDSIIPAEIMPTMYTVNFTLNGTRILSNNFEDMGLANYPGFNLDAPYMSLAITERLSGKPILNIKAGTVNTIDTSISAKGLATFNMSGTGFVALSGGAGGVPGFDGVPPQLPE